MWWWVACPQVGADAVVCVLTTTSCFAPRAPDDVVGVARLCARLGVPHLVNNAYGLQCAATTAQLTSACRKGGWRVVQGDVCCAVPACCMPGAVRAACRSPCRECPGVLWEACSVLHIQESSSAV
jgi:hypothetical protein